MPCFVYLLLHLKSHLYIVPYLGNRIRVSSLFLRDDPNHPHLRTPCPESSLQDPGPPREFQPRAFHQELVPADWDSASLSGVALQGPAFGEGPPGDAPACSCSVPGVVSSPLSGASKDSVIFQDWQMPSRWNLLPCLFNPLAWEFFTSLSAL